MKRQLTSLLLISTMLAGCQNNLGTATSPEELLESMKGPEISGVDATLLKMAKNAEANGDWRAASQNYQQLLDKDPSNETLAILYAETLRRSGEPNKALEVYGKVLDKYPTNLDAMEGKGLTQLSLADLDGASITLTKVAESNPHRWRTLNGIGILFATRGLYEDAQKYFDVALQKRPSHPAIINNKGLVQALDRKFSSSITSLLQASDVASQSMHKTQADLNAALVYAIAGDLDNAEVMASKHLDGAALQNNLGLYAMLAKNEDLARTHLHMALSESKVFYEKAWNNLDNLSRTHSTDFKQTNKSKSIRLSDKEGKGSIELPMLPQPGSASTPFAKSPGSQEDATQAKLSEAETANPTDAQKDIQLQTNAANNDKSKSMFTIAPPSEPTTTRFIAKAEEKEDSAPSNLNTVSTAEQESKATSNEQNGKLATPNFLTNLLTEFKSGIESIEDGAIANSGEDQDATVEIKADDAGEAGNRPANSNLTSDSSEGTKDATAVDSSDSKTNSNVILNNAELESGSDNSSQGEKAENTPSGVSEAELTPSSGNNDLFTIDAKKSMSDDTTPSNGFQSLEQYIKNW